MLVICVVAVVAVFWVFIQVVVHVVDGVAHHVEEHTDSSSRSAAAASPSWSWSWGRQLAEIGDPTDVTADLSSPVIRQATA